MTSSIRVNTTGRQKDPEVERQFREIIYKLNQLIIGTDGDTTDLQNALAALNSAFVNHKNNTSNPHDVTAEQVGAATPEYVQEAIAAISGSQIGDYKWSKNNKTGNLELFKTGLKIIIIDMMGNLKLRGNLFENSIYTGYTASIPGVGYNIE